MKTLTVRLSDEDFARLKSDAAAAYTTPAHHLLNAWDCVSGEAHTQAPIEPSSGLKEVRLKVPAAEHARMVDAAKRELIPLSRLLRNCFAEYARADRVAFVDSFTRTPHRMEVSVMKHKPRGGLTSYVAALRGLDGSIQVLPDRDGSREGFLTRESAINCALDYIAQQRLDA